MTDVKENSLLLSVKEASDLLGVSERLLYGLVSTNRLPVIRLGKRLFLQRKLLVQIAENGLALAV